MTSDTVYSALQCIFDWMLARTWLNHFIIQWIFPLIKEVASFYYSESCLSSMIYTLLYWTLAFIFSIKSYNSWSCYLKQSQFRILILRTINAVMWKKRVIGSLSIDVISTNCSFQANLVITNRLSSDLQNFLFPIRTNLSVLCGSKPRRFFGSLLIRSMMISNSSVPENELDSHCQLNRR